MLTAIKSTLRKHFWLRYITLSLHRLLIVVREKMTAVTNPNTGRDSHAYADLAYGYYRRFGEVEYFSGKVAEIGAGNDSQLAQKLIEDGAESVELIDRFFPGSSTDLRIVRHVADAETFFEGRAGYQFILSISTLEHLYDPLRALGSMAAALAPGGMMIHFVGTGDHGMFSPDLHALSFLRLPDVLYWPLRIQGGPNRYLVHDYRETLLSLPLKSAIYVYSLTGGKCDFLEEPLALENLPADLVAEALGYVNHFRKFLSSRFRQRADNDLAVTGLAIVARKPPQ